MASSETTVRLDSGFAPAFLALVSGAVALGFSAIFVRLAEAHGPPRPRKAFGRAAVLAGLAFSGDLFFWHLAILNTTVANATFFATTAPVFVVLVTWLVLRRRVEGATVARLALCLLGGPALIGASLRLHPA